VSDSLGELGAHLEAELKLEEPAEAAAGEPALQQAPNPASDLSADSPEAAPRKRRRRRRKPRSASHEARIDRYRHLVEDRGWIFAPPSPPRPVSWLFDDLTARQLESLAG
jgi:hypothetical protein